MRKLLLLQLALGISFFSIAQNAKVQAYIEKYKNIAIAEEIRTGVPASIKIAQGIIETSAGESDLVQRSNNHFGIKCKSEWDGEKVYHDDDAKGECFRSYSSAEESFRDHSEFLRTRKHYAFLFKLDPTDYEGWAYGLKKAGYATNPAYSKMLIKTIVENNLQQYTLLAIELKNKKENDLFVINAVAQQDDSEELPAGSDESIIASVQPDAAITTVAYKQSVEASYPAKSNKVVKKAAVNYPSGLFKINNLNVVYATAGTSLLALANKYNISFQKLLEFNDLPETDILANNQLLFLEKKLKKGTKDYHIVQSGETLYEISQKEGIRLQSILLFNKIMHGAEPVPGEKIYLRQPAPMAPKVYTNKEEIAFSNN